MSNFLHRVVETYIQNTVSDDEPLKEQHVKALEEYIKAEVLEEEKVKLVAEQKKIQKQLEEDFAKKRIEEKIKEANSIAFVAIFIGFVTGLLVNQTTDLISFLKSTLSLNLYQRGITIIIILVLIVAICLCYNMLFVNKIRKIISDKQ